MEIEQTGLKGEAASILRNVQKLGDILEMLQLF